MREKVGTNSPMLRGLEMIRESLAVGRVVLLSPSRKQQNTISDSQEQHVAEDRELFDICALGEEEEEEEDQEDQDNGRSEEQQEHLIMELMEKEDATNPIPISSSSSSSSPRVDLSIKQILDQEQQEGVQEGHMKKLQRRWLQKQRSMVSSREEAMEEAWEKKRRDKLLEEENNKNNNRNNNNSNSNSSNNSSRRSVGRSVSDCGDGRRTVAASWPLLQRTRSRTRSLTDEDMDELRGCIDLGFGFSCSDNNGGGEEDLELLCNTLPALELCYAIARQYNDVTSSSGRSGASSSSPVSTSSGRSSSSSSLDRCSSGGSSSLQSFPLESWHISSPGDHPSQVKTRLRHWAQAVACTVRQSF